MKFIGAFMIVSASMSLAALLILEKKKTIAELREVEAALLLARAELHLRALPLPALFTVLAERTSGSVKLFCISLCSGLERLEDESLYSLWSEAAEDCLRYIGEDAREELMRVGEVLGQYTLEDQLSALDNAAAFLHKRAQLEQELYSTHRRLCAGVPLCIGVLLIIVLF